MRGVACKVLPLFIAVLFLSSCAVKIERRAAVPETDGEGRTVETSPRLTLSPFADGGDVSVPITTETGKTPELSEETATIDKKTGKITTPSTTVRPQKQTEDTIENRPEEDANEYEDEGEYVVFDPNTLERGKYADRQKFRDVPLPAFKQVYVFEMADYFGVPAELIFGVMCVETGYTETLSSKNGRYIGIMQISLINMDYLNRLFGTTDLQDFCQNVQAGAHFLAKVYKQYGGDIDKTLMCYHLGGGGAKKKWAQGIYTDGYCNRVKKEMTRIVSAGWLDSAPV